MSPTRISAEVEKQLRATNQNADEILRKALDIKPQGLEIADGLNLPEETVLLVWYKEKAISALIKNGQVVTADGKAFTSVSGAAGHITGRPTTNGHTFWLVRFPGRNEFVSLTEARKSFNSPRRRASDMNAPRSVKSIDSPKRSKAA
jgi:hypothetical protein